MVLTLISLIMLLVCLAVELAMIFEDAAGSE